MPDGKVCPEQFRGWILKWTNYIKGYQRRWFVLANGLLSYYRTQEEMAHTCRGTINLAAAFIDTIDSTNFMITNGPSQVYHLRALNEVERQRWVTALELAKAKAIKKLDSDVSDCQSGSDDEEREGGGATGGGTNTGTDENLLSALQDKLKELTTANDLVIKNSHQLSKFVSELEAGGKPLEKVALLKITSAAMVKAAEEFMIQARNTERRWSRALQHEHSLRLQLQDNMEALANQMHGLEDEARLSVQGVLPSLPTASSAASTPASTPSEVTVAPGIPKATECLSKKLHSSDKVDGGREQGYDSDDEDDDDKFFDAPEMSLEDLGKSSKDSALSTLKEADYPVGHRRSFSATSVNDTSSMTCTSDSHVEEKLPQASSDRRMVVPAGPPPSFFEDTSMSTILQRRTTIPPKPSHKLNLWTVMKNCIGKDLSKIPMPVNFNEPLSMLQRMTEDLIYSSLLTKASQCSNTLEEAAYVAAYINSAYASTTVRVGKPFNPMLYETFEYDRRAEPDFGWRVITEQVSHHPPMFAMHVEHKDWTFWQEYTVTSKFRGKYLVCYPLGCCHLVMHASKSHYTWVKVVSTIHNIIVGKLWIDQSGELKLHNHTNGEECRVKYHAYSYFSREQQRKITGSIVDSKGNTCYVIKGHWDEKFTLAKVLSGEGKNVQTTPPEVLWCAEPAESGSDLIYGFSKFACSLNEPEEGVAPTDCRLRPDIRTMEEQNFDGANSEKVKLEEKQRARRRKREAIAVKAAEAAAAGDMEEAERLKKASTVCPVWFSKEYDPLTGNIMHVYKGGYWDAKRKGQWEELNLPAIF